MLGTKYLLLLSNFAVKNEEFFSLQSPQPQLASFRPAHDWSRHEKNYRVMADSFVLGSQRD
jgi:hypothetical protein